MQNQWIRALIVDSNAESLRRLSAVALADSAISLSGALSTGGAATVQLVQDRIDVLLVDLNLPKNDLIGLVRLAVSLPCPGRNVLLLAETAHDPNLLRGLMAGAGGCWLKGDDIGNIVAAIRAMYAGGSPISPRIGHLLLQALREGPNLPLPPDSLSTPLTTRAIGLTTREVEILQLVAKGLTIRAIARIYRISAHTVVTHLKSTYRKLNVHSRGEAVFEARQSGLI